MAREAKKLTKATLDSLRKKAQESPEFTAYLADSGQPGLYAWARRGKVRFVFVYRPPTGGRRKRIKIDDYGAITLPKARDIAGTLRGQVAERKDPRVERAEEQRLAVTVAEAVEGYLEDLNERAESGTSKRGKRSGYASAKYRLDRHVVTRFGKRPIRNVKVDNVLAMKRAMKTTPVEFNRTRTAFAAVFGFAGRAPRRWVPVGFNPVHDVEAYAETGTRRALTSKEMAALGEAMIEAEETGSVAVTEKGKPVVRNGKPVRSKVSPMAILAIRLLALTGFRRSEILGHTMKNRRGKREGLRWGDIDLDSGLIHLHDTKTGKQTRAIGATVIELLRSAKPKEAGAEDPVCPGSGPGREPLVGIDKPRKRLWEAAAITETAEGRADLHSLRHTFASVGVHVQNGRYAAFVGPLLGHGYQKRSVTERYIHSNPEALRPAVDAIAGAIAITLGLDKPGRVLAFDANRSQA